MSDSVQLLTWLNPQRYYQVVIRDIFLKGDGVDDQLLEFAMMLSPGVSALGISVFRIR